MPIGFVNLRVKVFLVLPLLADEVYVSKMLESYQILAINVHISDGIELVVSRPRPIVRKLSVARHSIDFLLHF